ncbi:Respiratory burst oxidase-like protein E [Bienertia sinuspersici]
MVMRQTSLGSGSSRRSSYSRGFQLPDDESAAAGSPVGGAMLPVFLKDIGGSSSRGSSSAATTASNNNGSYSNNNHSNGDNDEELLEVELQVEDDNIYICSVTPRATTPLSTRATSDGTTTTAGGGGGGGLLSRSLSAASKLRKKFPWPSSRASSEAGDPPLPTTTDRENRKLTAKLHRTTSGAQRALTGLRFISKTTCRTTPGNGSGSGGGGAAEELWKQVEARFDKLAPNGLLAREDFGECIGMMDSKEFAVGIFDALARRKRQRMRKINKDEMQDFWLQLTNQSFDARLQIFFDIADSNEDGKITRDEVQELIMLSASANKLSSLKDRAHEYANLIMEELDPENLGYIELWQLEALLLQRDAYMEYSRPLSTVSGGWSQNLSTFRPVSMVRKVSCTLRCLILENWQRGWIILLWIMAMASLFVWKFIQYRRNRRFMSWVIAYARPKGPRKP